MSKPAMSKTDTGGYVKARFSPLLTLIVLSLALSLTKPSAFTVNAQDTTGKTKVFWVEEINADGGLVLREYSSKSTRIINVPELEIWDKKLNTKDSIGLIYWGEPDWKRVLLEKGLARIKNDASLTDGYSDIEKQAKNERNGMWAELMPPLPQPSKGWIDKIIGFVGWQKYEQRLRNFKEWLVGFLGLSTLVALVKLIKTWEKRRKVKLKLIGLSSTGKSYLWHRLLDPEITESELLKTLGHRKSDDARRKATRSKAMGRYEITPIYYDTPGSKPGVQTAVMLEGSRGFQWLNKSIWMIMLATTPDHTISRSSPEEEKIDRDYISEQLGNLNSPVGLLASGKISPPKMVIVCIGKFDLFADNHPADSSSRDIIAELEGLFRQHIMRVENECKAKRIPSEVIFCSATKGWGTNDILRLIEKALFSSKSEKV